MKKVLLGCSLFLMIGILAGCVTIPIGDDELIISSDGIEYVTADNGENGNQSEETSSSPEDSDEKDDDVNDRDSGESDENTEGSNPEESADNGEQNGDENGDENAEEESGGQVAACEEHDLSDITDNLTIDFYFPDCSILTDVTKRTREITAVLMVEQRNWEDIVKEYVEFLGDQITREEKKISNQDAYIEAVLSDDGFYSIRIQQKNEDVSLRFTHKYPD